MVRYTYRTKDGDVLDKLCSIFYRRDDMMGRVLDANQHLYGVGCFLPRNVEVVFPDPPVNEPQKSVINQGLWGTK